MPISPDAIGCYLAHLEEKGRVSGTLEWYSRGLNRLCDFLPEHDTQIRRGSLKKWREALVAEGYAPSTVNEFIAAARVAEEKGNPRCLKRLYQTTREGIERNIALLVEQAQERLLEEEQLSIGWEER